MVLEIEVFSSSNRSLGKINVPESARIKDVKKKIYEISKIPTARQSVKAEVKGKSLGDDQDISSLKMGSSPKLFVKNLGPQIGWSTVFILEYAGPILVYLLVAWGQNVLYSDKRSKEPTLMAHLIFYAWITHYAKRILETLFVHRFSHGTMPLSNLFKNCSYYWGFAFYVAYHVNHPLWTEPPAVISYLGFALWTVSELGNLSIHLLLRDLRPAGSTTRKIPYPTGNILTILFNFVSCPNYTYEFGAWLGYSMMSGCLPALFFALVGFGQMSLWALGKHKNYKKEFSDYPKKRKAIFPFII